jgi:hypothetical protein
MRYRWIGLFLALAAFAACSPLHVTPSADVHALVTGQAYELMVRANHPELNRTLYDLAAESLGRVLPLSSKAPYTGAVQVDFASDEAVASTAYSAGYGGGAGWNAGASPATATPGANWYPGTSPTTAGMAPGSAGARTYFNGTLKVVVKDAAGKVLWSADYEHKGRWSLQSETPENVARVGLEKMAQALRTATAGERVPAKGVQ